VFLCAFLRAANFLSHSLTHSFILLLVLLHSVCNDFPSIAKLLYISASMKSCCCAAEVLQLFSLSIRLEKATQTFNGREEEEEERKEEQEDEAWKYQQFNDVGGLRQS